MFERKGFPSELVLKNELEDVMNQGPVSSIFKFYSMTGLPVLVNHQQSNEGSSFYAICYLICFVAAEPPNTSDIYLSISPNLHLLTHLVQTTTLLPYPDLISRRLCQIQVRSRYKALCSILGIHPRLTNSIFSNEAPDEKRT